MRNNTLIYEIKFQKALKETRIHINRINEAFEELLQNYQFPLIKHNFEDLINNKINLAFADQIIYRFSKAQDTMGAKLFKTYMLSQGENIDRPFLDILNSLEKLNILNVDEWFELREIRNEIAHDYEDNEELALNILNSIYKHKVELEKIITYLQK